MVIAFQAIGLMAEPQAPGKEDVHLNFFQAS